MARAPHDGDLPEPPGVSEEEIRLARRFSSDPLGGYQELLATYSATIQRMIRRFFRDWDEVMEVFTSICERLQANEYAALQRFREGSEILPWLSIIVANAARDRMRRTQAAAMPDVLQGKLSTFEQHVFRYHYRYRVPNEEAAEMLSHRLGKPYTARDVAAALDRINGLLGEAKRWRMIDRIALTSTALSIDALIEMGMEPADASFEAPNVSIERREQLRLLADALEAMEPEDQLVLQLRFEQDLSAVQIADILGYENYRYVYTRLQTILKRMRTLLDAQA